MSFCESHISHPSPFSIEVSHSRFSIFKAFSKHCTSFFSHNCSSNVCYLMQQQDSSIPHLLSYAINCNTKLVFLVYSPLFWRPMDRLVPIRLHRSTRIMAQIMSFLVCFLCFFCLICLLLSSIFWFYC